MDIVSSSSECLILCERYFLSEYAVGIYLTLCIFEMLTFIKYSANFTPWCLKNYGVKFNLQELFSKLLRRHSPRNYCFWCWFNSKIRIQKAIPERESYKSKCNRDLNRFLSRKWGHIESPYKIYMPYLVIVEKTIQ